MIRIRAILALEDGTIFEGVGFGFQCETSGEVVFSTGMVGYTESLTDPSYRGQILVQTYPLIGNYGVPSKEIKENGIPLHFESDSIQVRGYVVQSLSEIPSHWSNQKTLNEWLIEEKIPGIEGIDTRELTKRLRIKGTMLGILKVGNEISINEIESKLKNFEDPNKKDLVAEVSTKEVIKYGNGGSKIVLIDCGVKYGIIRNLVERGVQVLRVPYDYSADKILSLDPDGVVISNGPGDPKVCTKTIETIKKLMESGKPVLGICLGNQLLALAAGGDTYKLKFGHRGQNHPCELNGSRAGFITSQNHGFAIDEKSLDASQFEILFRHINDRTVEGIRHRTKPIFAVQFHPEASPGPYEAEVLFNEFCDEVMKCRS